jgi:hypothetical protein
MLADQPSREQCGHSASACSGISDVANGGAPSGRNRHDYATLMLPDTGIEAGRELQ